MMMKELATFNSQFHILHSNHTTLCSPPPRQRIPSNQPALPVSMNFRHFPRFFVIRTTALAVSLLGTLFNFALAARLLGAWRSSKWEPESEWESSGYSISKNGVSLIWALLCAYFFAASAICSFGLAGIIQSKQSFVRIYRHYVIGEFIFATLFAAIVSYAAFRPTVRSNVCELLSRQSDTFRDFIDLGLTFENCEPWFERSLFAFMIIIVIITAIRLHFVLALSSYYAILVRQQGFQQTPHYSDDESSGLERIYILSPPSSAIKGSCTSALQFVDAPVYAPVPLTEVPLQVAQELLANASEAWISRSNSTHQPPVRPRRFSLARTQAMRLSSDAVHTADLISLNDEKV